VAFKIADGYVEVHGRLDDASFRRSAERAGEHAGRHVTNAFDRSVKRRHGRITGIFRQMLTPDRDLYKSLLHPFERAFSIPLVAAIAGSIALHGATAIAAALQSAVLLGVGAGVVGLGAAILLGTEKMQKKAAEDRLKRVKKASADELKDMRATLRARITSMREAGASEAAIRGVRVAGEAAIARKVLENDRRIREAGKETSQTLTKAFGDAGKRIMEVLSDAAMPLQGPFRKALERVVGIVEELAPTFREMFIAAEPIIPLLVDIFEAFAKEILPVIAENMPAIVEMFKVLADRAPELADAVADLLDSMSKPETIEAFGYLLTGLIATIRVGTAALGFLTRAFNTGTREIKHAIGIVRGAIGTLKDAIGSIPVKWITHYLFSPGAAARAIARITNLTHLIPKRWQTLYRWLSGGAVGAIKSIIGWISRIPRNVTTTFTSITRNITESIIRMANPFARASGGIVGAQGMAAGGLSGSRTVLVGERGPELAELPFGSRVVPAGQTRAALEGAGGGGGPLVIHLSVGGRKLAEVLVDPLRKEIRSLGGDVQAVLGAG
jgi:hypothetical protein